MYSWQHNMVSREINPTPLICSLLWMNYSVAGQGRRGEVCLIDYRKEFGSVNQTVDWKIITLWSGTDY